MPFTLLSATIDIFAFEFASYQCEWTFSQQTGGDVPTNPITPTMSK